MALRFLSVYQMALVSLSVQSFPTESFIAHTADLSALSVDVMVSAFKSYSA